MKNNITTIQTLFREFSKSLAIVNERAEFAAEDAKDGNVAGVIGCLFTARQHLVNTIALIDAAVIVNQSDPLKK